MPRTRRRYVRRLSRTGAGWTLGEIIMIAIAFAAIVVALAIIIYEVEVNLPERQGVVQPDKYGMVNGQPPKPANKLRARRGAANS